MRQARAQETRVQKARLLKGRVWKARAHKAGVQEAPAHKADVKKRRGQKAPMRKRGETKRRRKHVFWALAVAIIGLVCGPMEPAAAAAGTGPGPMDPGALSAFFDAFVSPGLDAYNLPGVTVAVVADGALVFAEGYGYADRERGIAVDPERTLFDVGSVAKLFTFTAVMQLVEEGRLDLHTDVNTYLTRFQVEAAYPEPVTPAHLLTHTAGFDERDIGAAARSAEEVLPVCEYLAQQLPPRVRPPGELIAYSNHGTALAGCLVEEVSGMPFASYVERHIFEPLGMARSTFLWPQELMADMAVGYRQVNGALEPMDIYYRHFGPAGELKTTATDIARFMLAHLQEGSLADERILEPETAREMHRQQFTHHPLLPGFTYGFFEDELNGRRALVHGGDTNPIFSSLLVLLPEENVGLFVAHNTAEYAFRDALIEAFMDRYFPAPDPVPPPQPLAGHGDRAGRFEGTYAPTFLVRETTLEKMLTLFTQFRLTADAEGVLKLREPAELTRAAASQWVEIEPLVFQSLEGGELMVFLEDEGGQIMHMATSLYPGTAFVPRTWVDGPVLHLALAMAGGLLFISRVAAWLRRRGRGEVLWYQHVLSLVGGLNLIFILGLAVMLQVLAFDAIFGLPLWAQGLLVLPLVTTALTLGAVVGLAGAWRVGAGSVAGRVHDSLVVLAALAFAWQALYWNLTVFHL